MTRYMRSYAFYPEHDYPTSLILILKNLIKFSCHSFSCLSNVPLFVLPEALYRIGFLVTAYTYNKNRFPRS